jgi:hypothetical protein
VRATVWPVSDELAARLVQYRPFSFPDVLGREPATSPPVATGVFDIDDLAEDGPLLVSATHSLATGLFQHFSYPEALQVTSDGAVRIRYWGQDAQRVRAWAGSCGVEVSDQTVD